MKLGKSFRKIVNPKNAIKNVKKAVSGKTGKKVIRTVNKYAGRVTSVVAPVAGALFLGPVGAAAGTALGTGARYYGEKQGALASGKKGAQVKKAGRRGIKAGVIIGGSVTGASLLAAAAGVGGLASGPLLGSSAAAPAAAAPAAAAAAAPAAAAAGGGSGGLLAGIGAGISTIGGVASKLLGGGKVVGGAPGDAGAAGAYDASGGGGGGIFSGTGLDTATPEGRSNFLMLAAAGVALLVLMR